MQQLIALSTALAMAGDFTILAAEPCTFVVSPSPGAARSSGTGSGHKLGRPLAPGESARIAWRSGPGRGSLSHSEDAASIVALVEQVLTLSCTYRPSQAWPKAAEQSHSAISARDTAAR
jgi:hypothetical protein